MVPARAAATDAEPIEGSRWIGTNRGGSAGRTGR